MLLPCKKQKTSIQRNNTRTRLQRYPSALRSDAKVKRRSLVVSTLAVVLYTITFIETGGRFGQVETTLCAHL